MNRKMTGILAGICALAALATGAVAADDEWGNAGYNKGFKLESADEKFALTINNRVQFRFTYEDPDSPDEESSGSFRVRRFKFKMEGKAFGDWKYKLQAEVAGQSHQSVVTDIDVATDGSGNVTGVDYSSRTLRSTVSLEDAWVQYTRNPMAQLRVGQGRVFFGRQELTSSGKQQFVDRSIASNAFAHGRDIGVGLTGKNEDKTLEYGVGLYNGNGRNRSSNDNDSFLYAGRLVYTPFGEYKLEESALDYPESSKLAVGVSALRNTFGMDSDEEDLTTLGLEAAYKIRGFNAVGEYFSSSLEPSDSSVDDLDVAGYYLQAGYLFPNRHWEVAGRISGISPDVEGPSQDLTETGVAVSYYFSKHDYKLQADCRDLDFDDPDEVDSREFRLQLQLAF